MGMVRVFLAALVISVTGCASEKMTVSQDQTLASAPPAGKSRIVFMRDSFFGSAIQASLFDVTSGDPRFIGIVSNKTKLPYTVEPGKHVFMVISESADFMRANMAPGKTYYAMVTPRIGAWKARFSLHAIHKTAPDEFSTQSAQFQKWRSDTRVVENTPKSIQWARDNLSSVVSKQQAYWAKWQGKSSSELQQQTLEPDDGL